MIPESSMVPVRDCTCGRLFLRLPGDGRRGRGWGSGTGTGTGTGRGKVLFFYRLSASQHRRWRTALGGGKSDRMDEFRQTGRTCSASKGGGTLATTCQTPTDPIIDGNSWISVSLPGGIIGCGPDDNVGTPDWRKSLRRFKPTSDICLRFP